MKQYTINPQDVPCGYCQCGCGEKTTITPRGNPRRFIFGHHRVQFGPLYIVDDQTGCWIWQRYRHESGYGRMRFGGKKQYAHRWMYEQEVGKVPEGYDLDHLCRNRACVNPDHLEVVPHAVNVQRGKRAKLTHSQVDEIRAFPCETSTKDIAAHYGVCRSTIQKIRSGKYWAS